MFTTHLAYAAGCTFSVISNLLKLTSEAYKAPTFRFLITQKHIKLAHCLTKDLKFLLSPHGKLNEVTGGNVLEEGRDRSYCLIIKLWCTLKCLSNALLCSS